MKPEPQQEQRTGHVRPHMTVPIQMYPTQELLGPIGELSSGEPFTILETKGEWSEIKVRDTRGWVPSWYLDPNPDDRIIEKLATPVVRVLKRSTPVSLYPDGPTGALHELQAGKLLTVLYRYQDWAFVEIMVYSIPDYLFGWVKDDLLVGLDQVTPSEGYLKLGAQVYHDYEQKQFYETITFCRAVMIHERRGGMVHIFAAGGWDGWTKLGNIVYQRE